ncbi:alpha/beta fold hydrolase [Streptomyces sp. cmx-4-9]|uniref:alpha/beta fold hydrolase n=1 Tax=Streptomyces sp. cmx-4-9 TaxID=2790941 RepID=UPI003980D157
MPVLFNEGFRLDYQDTGTGAPVVLVMGSGGSGSVWHLHQVPALVAAGHRVVTLDNRGVAQDGSGGAGFTVADMAGDVAALIEHLGIGPCAVAGTSLGARVAAELALTRPELVRRLVLMAARGRSDALSTAMVLAEQELDELGIELPARYRAVVQALQQLSRQVLTDDTRATDWLDLFELSEPARATVRAQRRLYPMPDRLAAYRAIRAPTHVIAFADDMLAPPVRGREIAAAVPGATFEVIDGCGHLGYLEEPETVNAALVAALGLPPAVV